MCVYALKEIIDYYQQLNTPVFVCFLDLKSAFDRVSYNELFCKLLERNVPLYLVKLLNMWYTSQNLFVGWGKCCSRGFKMTNGIRQGSLISPYLFNVYMDELNRRLCGMKVGCRIAGQSTNNLAYADDLVILAPTGRALNALLKVCETYAAENYIIFNATKSVCMLITPRDEHKFVRPNIYLCGEMLEFVNKHKYLGNIITSNLSDEEDIQREMRSMYSRGNLLLRKFSFCSEEIKITLFRTYCYSLYGCCLWARYRVAKIQRMKICYNNIFRKLFRIPPFVSPRCKFVEYEVLSYGENIRKRTHSMLTRLQSSQNCIIKTLMTCDSFANSRILARYREHLFTSTPNVIFPV